ncbi:TetR/AcrR family transcriptional regulator [Kitasatospora sp. NPDC051853]|uniref:TetR/AcrR family transcriptional regulator n=1 Tax=Kitasatospora sp. NPDC051853 TaxID=3364058 RepID=UPI00378F8042
MTTETGLRESKKRETRQLISDCATRLFIEQGFERTTIAEIAAAARVAKKTVTNYFARKEDLALDRYEEFTQGLARAVAGRGPAEVPLDAVSRAFRAALMAHDPAVGFTGPAFARMIADSPTLTARIRELHDLREEALAGALADAVPQGTPPIVPRAAAALIAAADRLVFHRIQELTLAGRADEEIVAMLLPETDHLRALLVAADAVGDGVGGGVGDGPADTFR